MLRLQVPNREEHRSAALHAGAHQSKDGRWFYASSKDTYGQFLPWIINQGTIVVCDELFIVEGGCTCPRCSASTRAVVPAVQTYFDFSGVHGRDDVVGHVIEDFFSSDLGVLRFCAPIYPMPARIFEWLQQKYLISVERAVDFPGGESVMSCCDRCGAPLTFWHVLGDVSSSFVGISEKKAARLKVYQFHLIWDFVTQGRIVGEPISLSLIDKAQIIPVDPESELLSTPPLNV